MPQKIALKWTTLWLLRCSSWSHKHFPPQRAGIFCLYHSECSGSGWKGTQKSAFFCWMLEKKKGKGKIKLNLNGNPAGVKQQFHDFTSWSDARRQSVLFLRRSEEGWWRCGGVHSRAWQVNLRSRSGGAARVQTSSKLCVPRSGVEATRQSARQSEVKGSNLTPSL